MKIFILLACLLAAGSSHGQTAWFTVLGDAANPLVDTIEVDPTPVSANVETQTMRVRVSRASLRKSWEGVPYRSYTSEVVFDCSSKTGRYTTLVFYMQPGWKGESHNTSVYTQKNPRWMRFLDVHPNPTERIIRAACKSGSVTTGEVPSLPVSGLTELHLL